MLKKKILVCGATGFIGRNIVENFAKNKNFEVHAIYNKRKPFIKKNIFWHKVDLRNPLTVNKVIKGVNILIQAAATTSGVKDIINQPYLHVTDNAIMNSYILRSAYESCIDHVFFFSCTVMYHSSNKDLMENDFDPSRELQNKYYGVGHTKLYIEKLCEFYSGLGKTKFTVIRHSNIYGPYDKFNLKNSHFFGASISKIMTQNKEIKIWGEGSEKRDFLHISDLINFLDKVLKHQKKQFRLYNCSYGKAYSIKQIIKKMINISKKNLKISYDISKPSINSDMRISSKLAYKELNWRPKVSIDKGIKQTFLWWKKNINNKNLSMKN